MNAVPYFSYDESGRILSVGSAPHEMIELQANSGNTIRSEESADPDTQYMLNGELETRPTMSAVLDKSVIQANSQEEATISNVVAGTAIAVRGPIQMNGVMDEDGPLILTLSLPGTYKVFLSNFPYQDKEFVINAV